MFHKVKTNILNMNRASVLCGVLFVAILALCPLAVEAQCTQWDVSGKWILKITKGILEEMDLKQNGVNIGGKSYAYSTSAKVIGTVKGNDFNLYIDWKAEGSTFAPGVASFEGFFGKIGPDGFIHGHATTQVNPDLSGTKNPWSSDRAMKCVRGKAQPSAPAPPPPPMKVPGIVASQVVFPFPGALSGFAVLTWDGGPDHPYAEVWVKVNGGDATFVVEQGKGGRQVTVERGKAYLYILTDDGKTLATVDVVPF